ncbi:MAG TPA: recombinase family protein [Mycobacterium sp.]|nr:recombinase family protein [Mycobacterium sp.]
MRAGMYLRISLDRDGRQLAVSRQREDCLKLCRSKGWEPVEYCDNSVSATSGRTRPAYQRMLDDVRDGHLGAVVVWDLDRLHRQPRELEDFIDLADTHKLELATVTGDCDLSTDNGRLFARIKGAVGKSETERKSARQRRAARQLAESGRPKWKRCFGYIATDAGPVPDPKVAPLVKQAYAAVLAGSSLSDICRLWNGAGALTRGGKQWTAPQVSNFLRKPRNAGLRTYQADPHRCDRDSIVGKGAWEPLVDEELFWSVMALMGDRKRRPGPKSVRRYLLTNVMVCGKCRTGVLAARWSPKRADASHSIVYVCSTCRGVSVRAEHVEPVVYAEVAARLARPDAVDLLNAEQHDAAEAEALRVEETTLRAQLDQLGADYAESLLTARQVKVATDVIESKLEAIQRQQHDSERLRVFDGIPLGTPEVETSIRALSPDRFRAVLDAIATVKVMPVGKGGYVFNPDRVKVVFG